MGTILVAIRHAKPNADGSEDPSLSQEGIDTQKKMTDLLKENLYFPNKIYCSPLLRACQTAEIIADAFGINFDQEDALGNDFDEDLILKLIPDPNENQTIYFIGHEPTLANFVNKLVGQNVLQWGLSKSGAAVVEFKDKVDFGTAHFINVFNP